MASYMRGYATAGSKSLAALLFLLVLLQSVAAAPYLR